MRPPPVTFIPKAYNRNCFELTMRLSNLAEHAMNGSPFESLPEPFFAPNIPAMSREFISVAAIAVSLVFMDLSQADEDGYTPLLDATHDTGWKHAGAGEMRVERGVATTLTPKESPHGGVFYYQKKRFSDFSVRLEFRVDSPDA